MRWPRPSRWWLQIHHIPGDLARFLLTWSVLLLGVVYALRSFTTALLMLVLLTWYAGVDRFGEHVFGDRPWAYLVLLAALLPFLWGWLRDHTRSVSTFWLALLTALSMAYVEPAVPDLARPERVGAAVPDGLAGAFTLVPVLAGERGDAAAGLPRRGHQRPVAGAVLLQLERPVEGGRGRAPSAADVAPLGVALAPAGAAYLAARRLRRPFSGSLFPEVPMSSCPSWSSPPSPPAWRPCW